MIVFAGLLVSAGLQAQRVYIEKDDQGNKKRVILDLTEAAGMPAGAITSDSKTVMFNNLIAQHGVPSSTNVFWHRDNQTSADINKTVFEKLEVAPKDMNSARVIGGTGTMTMSWVAAFNGCINSDYDSGGWRLPTQRELQMMWIFKEALNPALSELSPSGTGAALLSASYRGATEHGATTAWHVNFGTGFMNNDILYNKSNSTRVRCVREVTN
jgi:hypothetical protein